MEELSSMYLSEYEKDIERADIVIMEEIAKKKVIIIPGVPKKGVLKLFRKKMK